jgi:hypothetical protein
MQKKMTLQELMAGLELKRVKGSGNMFKQGQMINVRDHGNGEWREREFIAMSECDGYVCWSKNKTFVYEWEEAREIDHQKVKGSGKDE